ncbi:MAG: preprotein translocase subunit SecE [Armatimonadia bacterium]|nr:preprotein translocase subunit SecE [Armatimonadia bacterium]
MASGTAKPFFIIGWYRSARRFLKEVMHELREVVWPSWDEIKHYTILVLTVIVGVAAYIALFQAIFQWVADSWLDLYGTHGRSIV